MRAPDAGRKGGAVALRLLGKAPEQTLRRVDKAVERRRLKGFGDRLRQSAVAHQPIAKAAEDERTHEARFGKREEARDPRAHGIAHDVSALDAQMRKQVDRIPDHKIGAIVTRRVELFALPMTAIVERDDTAPSLRQSFDPTRVDPVHATVGGKAMNEQNRLAQIASLSRNVDKGDVDAVR